MINMYKGHAAIKSHRADPAPPPFGALLRHHSSASGSFRPGLVGQERLGPYNVI